jgi:hypothetical protein
MTVWQNAEIKWAFRFAWIFVVILFLLQDANSLLPQQKGLRFFLPSSKWNDTLCAEWKV